MALRWRDLMTQHANNTILSDKKIHTPNNVIDSIESPIFDEIITIARVDKR